MSANAHQTSARRAPKSGEGCPARHRVVQSRSATYRPRTASTYTPDHFTEDASPARTPAANSHGRGPEAGPTRHEAGQGIRGER